MDSSDNIDDMDNVDDLYSDEEEHNYDDYVDDGDGDGNDFEVNAGGDYQRQEKNYYTILKESEIPQRMENDITQLCTVLSISKQEASILLRHYNWTVSKVHDAWFADESGVRKKVGLLEKPEQVLDHDQTSDDLIITCGICFDSFSHDLIKSAACGHPFCGECWRLYISSKVNEGVGCLMLKCPQLACGVSVGEDIINELGLEEDKEKYYTFLARSYVEDNKKRKWCPAPDCDCAIDFDASACEDFDVSCQCSHSFCWNCCEERHRPVRCETVANWVSKNSSESENETWKKAYTKPCPSCKRPIEKNEGCMRMVCSAPCRYVFCWLCLNDWSTHGYSGPCNRFFGNLEDNGTSSLREDLLKYQHYYDRWAANEKSKQIALADLQKVQNKHIKEIGCIHSQSESNLRFLTEAWKQIVECRRVLKWTYAYGYYLPKNEDAKKQLFEYLQGQAESSLERLHECAERELKEFLDPHSKSDEFLDPDSRWGKFNDFRNKLTNLTLVTKNYFENLVRALENELSDVIHSSDVASSSKKQKNCSLEYTSRPMYSRITHTVDSSRTTHAENLMPYAAVARGGRAARGARAANNLARTAAQTDARITEQNARQAANNLAQPAAQTDTKITEQNAPQDPWTCEFCSYVNVGSAVACKICDQGAWSCQQCTYANPRTATTCLLCDGNR